MYKVYGIYGNKDAFFTETFFVKLNRAITWVKSDLKLNGRPYYSDEKMKSFLSQSSQADKFTKLKEGESFDIQYGTCSNHYRIVKMTSQEIETINEIQNKNTELEKVRKEIQKNIPVELSQKMKNLTKDLKKLNVQTM